MAWDVVLIASLLCGGLILSKGEGALAASSATLELRSATQAPSSLESLRPFGLDQGLQQTRNVHRSSHSQGAGTTAVRHTKGAQEQLFSEAKARELRVGIDRGGGGKDVVQLILIDPAGREEVVPISRGLEDGVLLSQWDEDDALLIESELQEKAGAYYRLPSTRDELLAELSLPKSSVLSELEMMDLLAVQIERQLGTTPATSAFLLEQMDLRRQREAVAEGQDAAAAVEFDFDELERDLHSMYVGLSTSDSSESQDAPTSGSVAATESLGGASSLGSVNSSTIRELIVGALGGRGRGLMERKEKQADPIRIEASLAIQNSNSTKSESLRITTPLRSLTSPAVIEADGNSISTSL